VHGTFSTAGSDGTISFWDKQNKTRLKSFNLKDSNSGATSLPVAATAFSRTNGSNIFAYAISYDWAHGYAGNSPDHPNIVKVHACKVGSGHLVRAT
jgi:mRNA export factor